MGPLALVRSRDDERMGRDRICPGEDSYFLHRVRYVLCVRLVSVQKTELVHLYEAFYASDCLTLFYPYFTLFYPYFYLTLPLVN
jgi:hypothetical protein